MMKSATQHKLNSSTNAWYIIITFSIIMLVVCFFHAMIRRKKQPALFEALDSKTTGIDFANKLTPTAAVQYV